LAAFKPTTADQKTMVAHYKAMIDALDTAKADGKKPDAIFEQAKPTPTKQAPTAPVNQTELNGVQISRMATPDFVFTVKTIQGDALVDQGSENYRAEVGRAFILKAGPVEAKIYPYASGTVKPRALQGTVRINVEGNQTTTAVMDAMRTLEAVGIDARPPTAAQRELLYLHKTIHARGDAEKVTALFDSTGDDDSKIEAIKKWAEKAYGVKLPRKQSEWGRYYNPEGELPSNGVGNRTYRRWDVDPAKAKTLEQKSLFFHQGNIEAATLGWLTNGGHVTTTEHRLRTGTQMVDGASWQSDFRRGGSNFLYTNRIANTQRPGNGFYFKGDLLSRVDLQSHTYDSFGEWEAQNSDAKRRRTIDTIATPTSVGICSNTGLFKNGMSVEDVEFIKIGSEASRKTLIAKIRSAGIDKWPDGRQLEDVIQA